LVMGSAEQPAFPTYVTDALPNSHRLTVGDAAQDPAPLDEWKQPGERERRRIYLSVLMGIVASYWNGNKFGPRGTYYARDAQVDRDIGPAAGNYYVYRATGRAYRGQQRDLGDTYVGHNIAALAVNGAGHLIDFEMNSNEIFDSSMEHAEARLVRRIINLAESWEAQDWIPDQQKMKAAEEATTDAKNKELRRTNLEGITIYTSLESCAQCAGIMALGNIEEVVYLQRDPGMFCIGNILFRFRQNKDSAAVHPPRPAAAKEFEDGTSYFDLLGEAYERFKRAIAEVGKFYVPPSGNRGNPDPPSITSFLCTDEAFDIFNHGGRRLEDMQLQVPEYQPGQGAMTNSAVLQDAKIFLNGYVVNRGRRGITHLV
jgi:tRNA(Arg) A34 adenosine deaminase TadA